MMLLDVNSYYILREFGLDKPGIGQMVKNRRSFIPYRGISWLLDGVKNISVLLK